MSLRDKLLSLLDRVSPDLLKRYVDTDTSLVDLLDSYLTSPPLRRLVAAQLRAHWGKVEPLLTDATRAREEIARRKPELRDLLYNDEKTIRWLNRQVEELYRYLYRLAWQEKAE